MIRIAITALALVLAALPARAEKTLQWEVIVDAPVADVWRAFTVEDVVEKWMVPNTKIDLRIGGQMRNSYDPAADVMDPAAPGVIVHTYLAFEPERMIASRVTVPEGAPVPKCIEEAWSVTRFEPLSPTRTRLTLTSVGWGEGPDWDQAEEFFRAGNQWTLEQLHALFPAPSADTHNNTFAELRRVIGGEWIHEKVNDDGSAFRVLSVFERGPSDHCIVSKGWLGDAQGMFPHGASQIWREPGTGEVRFQSIDENGAIARGGITLADDDTLVWDWNMTRQTGQPDRYRVEMKFTGPDEYVMNITRLRDDGTESPMVVDMTIRRVEKAPDTFHKVHPAAAAP